MKAELTIREAGSTSVRYWRDLWASRHLIATLAVRDVSVRYKQSAMGVTWALVRPLVTMAVFSFVFGHVAGLPADGGMPYALMVLGGMVPWILFSTSLPDISNSLTSNTNLVEKVFFPRLVLPISSVSNSLLEFLICVTLLLILMVAYGVPFSVTLAALPLFAVLALGTSLGLGIWWSAVNVRYRDIRYLVPFVTQVGLYVTPVAYSSQIVPERWKPIFYLNPMASAADGFRWAINGGATALYVPGLVIGACVSIALLLIGTHYFRRTERTFADYI